MIPKTILVPIDFSDASEQALEYACSLASSLGATLHLVNAVGAATPELTMALTDKMMVTLVDEHRAALEQLVDSRRSLVAFGTITVKWGDPRDLITETADLIDADLIVMGTHGRRGLSRFFVGSVAEDVARRAPCPVLLVRMKKARR